MRKGYTDKHAGAILNGTVRAPVTLSIIKWIKLYPVHLMNMIQAGDLSLRNDVYKSLQAELSRSNNQELYNNKRRKREAAAKKNISKKLKRRGLILYGYRP